MCIGLSKKRKNNNKKIANKNEKKKERTKAMIYIFKYIKNRAEGCHFFTTNNSNKTSILNLVSLMVPKNKLKTFVFIC